MTGGQNPSGYDYHFFPYPKKVVSLAYLYKFFGAFLTQSNCPLPALQVKTSHHHQRKTSLKEKKQIFSPSRKTL